MRKRDSPRNRGGGGRLAASFLRRVFGDSRTAPAPLPPGRRELSPVFFVSSSQKRRPPTTAQQQLWVQFALLHFLCATRLLSAQRCCEAFLKVCPPQASPAAPRSEEAFSGSGWLATRHAARNLPVRGLAMKGIGKDQPLPGASSLEDFGEFAFSSSRRSAELGREDPSGRVQKKRPAVDAASEVEGSREESLGEETNPKASSLQPPTARALRARRRSTRLEGGGLSASVRKQDEERPAAAVDDSGNSGEASASGQVLPGRAPVLRKKGVSRAQGVARAAIPLQVREAPCKPPPKFFAKTWAAILRMREARDAPVDSMGVEAQTGKDEKERRFAVLLASMLSSQTRDEQTNACVDRLRREGLLSPQAILDCPEGFAVKDASAETRLRGVFAGRLFELLQGVGFARNKTRFLKEAAAELLEKYEGDIPPSLESLMSLKGVGRKMANIVMHSAWGRFQGIAVDVHVHRISNSEHWEDLNLVLVGFGQQICKAQQPQCEGCLARVYCPFGRRKGERPPQSSDENENENEAAE